MNLHSTVGTLITVRLSSHSFFFFNPSSIITLSIVHSLYLIKSLLIRIILIVLLNLCIMSIIILFFLLSFILIPNLSFILLFQQIPSPNHIAYFYLLLLFYWLLLFVQKVHKVLFVHLLFSLLLFPFFCFHFQVVYQNIMHDVLSNPIYPSIRFIF